MPSPTIPVYSFVIITGTPPLLSWASAYTAATMRVLSLLIMLVFVAVNLTSIHACYYGICMPEENEKQQTKEKSKQKESFLDAYRRQRDERREALRERKKSDDKRN